MTKLDENLYKFSIEGYDFGDRTLEGVFFEVVVNGTPKDYAFEVKLKRGKNNKYLKQLNMEYFMSQARDYIDDELQEIAAADTANPGVWEDVLTNTGPKDLLER